MLRLVMRSNSILPVWGLTKVVSKLKPKDSILLRSPALQIIAIDRLTIGHIITGHVTPCDLSLYHRLCDTPQHFMIAHAT